MSFAACSLKRLQINNRVAAFAIMYTVSFFNRSVYALRLIGISMSLALAVPQRLQFVLQLALLVLDIAYTHIYNLDLRDAPLTICSFLYIAHVAPTNYVRS